MANMMAVQRTSAIGFCLVFLAACSEGSPSGLPQAGDSSSQAPEPTGGSAPLTGGAQTGGSLSSATGGALASGGMLTTGGNSTSLDASVLVTDAGMTDPPASRGSDDIFGQSVVRTDSFWTQGGRIYRGSDEVRLFGLNWFGLEGTALALYGPTESGRSVSDFLMQLQSSGFNALRIPVSPQTIAPGVTSEGWTVRGDLDTGREFLGELLSAAHALGIYVLLDIHTCLNTVGYLASKPDDPQCNGYTVTHWIADLTTLADLAANYAPTVVGIDLFNEPYALTWPEWRALAEQGGEAVLRKNPRILVFVEGVGAEGYSGSHGPFWGENLSQVASDPVSLPSTRLVYTPHVYGPSVYAQTYFADASFPANMPAIWDDHFGVLFDGQHTLVVGEFGGKYIDADRTWQDAFVSYLIDRGARSFFYWCLNPNSGDTGGLLLDDWQTFNQDKLTLLQRLMQTP